MAKAPAWMCDECPAPFLSPGTDQRGQADDGPDVHPPFPYRERPAPMRMKGARALPNAPAKDSIVSTGRPVRRADPLQGHFGKDFVFSAHRIPGPRCTGRGGPGDCPDRTEHEFPGPGLRRSRARTTKVRSAIPAVGFRRCRSANLGALLFGLPDGVELVDVGRQGIEFPEDDQVAEGYFVRVGGHRVAHDRFPPRFLGRGAIWCAPDAKPPAGKRRDDRNSVGRVPWSRRRNRGGWLCPPCWGDDFSSIGRPRGDSFVPRDRAKLAGAFGPVRMRGRVRRDGRVERAPSSPYWFIFGQRSRG